MDDPFLIAVPRALTYLYREGRAGHWTDVRTTSEAVMALVASGESIQCPHLQVASDFLLKNFHSEQEGGSWGSELWDTAVAIRAVIRLPARKEETVKDAFHWMLAKRLPNGSFDGEPWDSMFVCLAALDAGKANEILKTTDWFLSLQSQNGAFISSHYTGLFCQVLGLAIDADVPSFVRPRLNEASIRALQFLWGEYSRARLWGDSTWTNAYIIRGMLALHHPQIVACYDDILNWYVARQADNGAWDDAVRTAIVVEMLLALRIAYEIERCKSKPLQALSLDVLTRSRENELVTAVQLKTIKAPLTRDKKLLDRDEEGNRVITLTPLTQMYLAIIMFSLSLAFSLIRNWNLVHRFLFP